MSTLCNDFITDDFLKIINELRVKKGFENDTKKCKILGFTFIFVDNRNCHSVVVDDCELNTKDIEISYCSNIVVLLNTETEYAGYWNHNYIFIGIFNRYNKESNIEFESIAISSLNIVSDFNSCIYDSKLISSYDIVFIDNPFEKYIKKMITPIRKAINRNIPKNHSYKMYINDDILNTLNFSANRMCEYNVITGFNDLLTEVKELDENITNKLCYRKFKPEDYSD